MALIIWVIYRLSMGYVWVILLCGMDVMRKSIVNAVHRHKKIKG